MSGSIGRRKSENRFFQMHVKEVAKGKKENLRDF